MEERYSRQILYSQIGEEGQEKLFAGKVLVVGCGALGSNVINLLARAGVRYIKVVDKDIVEISNLPRQTMFSETDVRKKTPKAVAAKKYIKVINKEVLIEPLVATVEAKNMEELAVGMDLVIDGTDNFETRYIINDACVRLVLPWIYGGVIGASGATMTFLPGGPCLACLWPTPPETANTPSTSTHGVLNTAPAMIACIQATEAIKILTGATPRNNLWHLELWEGNSATVNVMKNENCQTCSKV